MSTVIETRAMEAPGAEDDARRSVLAAFGWSLARDVRIALRSRAELGVQLLFYVIVVSLFPLAASPSREFLNTIGPGVLWTAALLASLLSLPRLFAADFADGTLEQIALSPRPLPALVSGKIAAHWLTTGLPVALMAPLLGVQYALEPSVLGTLMLALLIGTPILSLLGAVGAALTLGARRSSTISPASLKARAALSTARRVSSVTGAKPSSVYHAARQPRIAAARLNNEFDPEAAW